jgi:hypothetical protein
MIKIGGVKTAATSAVLGGVILAMIEGLGVMLTRMAADQYKPVRHADIPAPPPPVATTSPSSSSSSSPTNGGSDSNNQQSFSWDGQQSQQTSESYSL